MARSLTITVYYFEGHFYLPTTVLSLEGMVSVVEPLTLVPAGDRAALAEAIELQAVAGNATLSRADFRAASDNLLVLAMRLPNRQAFFTRARRWAIVEDDGVYALIPFKPAPMRGVVEDTAHAVTLPPATFATEAVALMTAQIG